MPSGIEFSEDFRLLEDIGWRGREDRESFDLSMPAHDLMELLQRLHGEAERVLLESITERESREEDAETNDRTHWRARLLGGRGAGHREDAGRRRRDSIRSERYRTIVKLSDLGAERAPAGSVAVMRSV